MTDYTLSGAFGAGPGASASDPSNQYTLGLQWGTTAGAPLWLKGYEFWRADSAVDGPISAETWDQSGVAVPGSVATFILAGVGTYQQVLLPTPVSINVGPGNGYVTGAHFPDGAYAFTADYWSSGAGSAGHTVGRLVAPNQASAPSNEQGVLIPGAVRAFPSDGSGVAANYYVTPILTDVDPTPSGAVDLPVSVGMSTVGAKSTTAAVTSPVLIGASTTGAKSAAGAVSTPVQVGAALAGQHQGVGAVSHAVNLAASIAGENPGASPYSSVLCAAWASEDDVPEAIRAELALTETQWARAFMVASEILWALSGRRWYGPGCLEEAYLRSTPPRPGTGAWPYHQSWGDCGCWLQADWINGYPVAPFLGEWSHVGGVYAVKLPRDTVTEVTSVTINGVPFTSYNLTRSGWLERIDGDSWDVCSGATVVNYRHGEPPPLGGVQAAVTLAIELARDFYGLGKCRLPKRVSTVTRQGVTVDIVDSLDILKEGGTGLTSVDLWLRAVNPEARPQRAGVWSPDLPRTMLRRPL